MSDSANKLIQTHLDDAHLPGFANRLTGWLIADLNKSEASAPDFTESRAKALLRAANVVDDPTRHSFVKLTENNPTAVRIALYDLLTNSELAENEEVMALAAVSGAGEVDDTPISWMALAIAAFAWKSGYPLYQLDPAAPPDQYSPAGQLITRAAHFMRQQVQLSATERDKLGRQLAYAPGDALPGTPSLDQLPNQPPMAPVPPHFRSPIPVNYPEVAAETVHIDTDEASDPVLDVDAFGEESPSTPERGAPITITDEDLPTENQPLTMPPLRIRADQIPPERRTVVRANTRAQPQQNFTEAVQRKFGRQRGPMVTTKLRVMVQEYAEGPGLYGVQVRVSCPGIRNQVAGTTNREGKFLCELPVPKHTGLTYDVEVTWPRDVGGDVERKSITLNGDRTEFVLPFYQRIHP